MNAERGFTWDKVPVRASRLIALAIIGTLLATLTAGSAFAGSPTSVIVRAEAGNQAAAADVVRSVGGRIGMRLGII